MFLLLFRPRTGWESIKRSRYSALEVFLLHSVPFALIAPVCGYLGTTRTGWSLGLDRPVRLIEDSALQIAVLYYGALPVAVLSVAWAVYWMARTHGAQQSFASGLVLASMTATLRLQSVAQAEAAGSAPAPPPVHCPRRPVPMQHADPGPSPIATARAWYRQPLVWMIIAIPASSVVVGMVMLWLAIASFDGMVADDYYERGMQINRVLDRERAAERAGLSAQLDFRPGLVILELHAVADGFRMPPTLNLDLSYATRAGRDQRLLLVRSVAGDYRAPSPPLGVGRYYVHASGEQWRITGVLDVPGSMRTRLAPPRAR